MPAPLVSVIIEGLNEVRQDTSALATLDAVAAQDYPLEQVELILVGSPDQYRHWREATVQDARFRRILTLEAAEVPYYELKNLGLEHATGEIVAFADSDVIPVPGWLPAIVAAVKDGAEVTAGVSRFFNHGRVRLPEVLLDAAASVCFGHSIGRGHGDVRAPAGGMLGHNIGARREAFRATRFGGEGAARSPTALFVRLRASGMRIDFVPQQVISHSFSATWFVYPFHIRVGWEEFASRRVRADVDNAFLRRAGILEPLLGAALYVAVDLRVWPRFSRALGHSRRQRLLRWPLVLMPSLVARTAGMLGGYAAMIAPVRSQAWAEAN